MSPFSSKQIECEDDITEEIEEDDPSGGIKISNYVGSNLMIPKILEAFIQFS